MRRKGDGESSEIERGRNMDKEGAIERGRGKERKEKRKEKGRGGNGGEEGEREVQRSTGR